MCFLSFGVYVQTKIEKGLGGGCQLGYYQVSGIANVKVALKGLELHRWVR